MADFISWLAIAFLAIGLIGGWFRVFDWIRDIRRTINKNRSHG